MVSPYPRSSVIKFRVFVCVIYFSTLIDNFQPKLCESTADYSCRRLQKRIFGFRQHEKNLNVTFEDAVDNSASWNGFQ